jgi:hypothetical protein
MSNENREWVGGKQIYPGKNTSQSNSVTDDWLSNLTDEDFGFGGCGFKPKKDSFKVENSKKEQK